MPAMTSAAIEVSVLARETEDIGARLGACCFDSVRAALDKLDFSSGTIPGIDALNHRVKESREPVVTVRGNAIRFCAQGAAAAAIAYEREIFSRGIVPTRPGNVHDFFNALVWLSFPRTKAAINARHVALAAADGLDGNRSPARDALTLFDECGVIVLSDQPDLLAHVKEFRWKELFWNRRDAVRQHMRFMVFGHGLMEQLLCPYVGLIGKALLIPVNETWLGGSGPRPPSIGALLQHIDAASSDLVAEPAPRGLGPFLSRGRDLAPLPMLGIPDWAAENNTESYYDNRDYFRPGRRA